MNARARARAVLDRIGGPHSLTWPVFAIVYVFTWLAYLAATPTVSWANPWARIAALTLCQLAMFVVLLFAKVTVLRNTDLQPRPWTTLVVFLLAAVAARMPLGYLLEWWGLTPTGSVTTGVPSAVPATFVVLALAALAVDALAEQRHRRNLLVAQRERLDHTRAVITAVINERQQATIQQINRDLTNAIDALDAGSPREAVETLRWTAQELVRPLSHDLATQRDSFTPIVPPGTPLGLDWPGVLRDATTGHPIPPITFAVVLTALSVVFRITRMGATAGLIATVAIMVALWAGAQFANRVLARLSDRLSTPGRAVAGTIALILLGFVVAAIEWLIASDRHSPGSLILAIWVTVFIGWALALARGVQHQAARTEAELRAINRELDWEVARANQTQWQQQRALARALHGPVQASVNAAALRLDAAVRDGSVTPALIQVERDLIAEAVALLPTAIAESTPDIGLAFRRIQGTWAGICEIDVDAAPTVIENISADPACSGAVADIVTESCANAVRHGHATRITVSITQPNTQRLLFISIDNDGDPLDPTSRAGLGTSVLDDVALEWHLDAQPHGTRMTAVLPTSVGRTRGTGRYGSAARDPVPTSIDI